MLLVLVLSLPFASHADDCLDIGEFSGRVMETRQNGIPEKIVVDAFAGHEDIPSRKAFAISVVYSAYNMPLFDDPEQKAEAVTEFSKAMVRMCREAEGEGLFLGDELWKK